jgi:hypothetical protein
VYNLEELDAVQKRRHAFFKQNCEMPNLENKENKVSEETLFFSMLNHPNQAKILCNRKNR